MFMSAEQTCSNMTAHRLAGKLHKANIVLINHYIVSTVAQFSNWSVSPALHYCCYGCQASRSHTPRVMTLMVEDLPQELLWLQYFWNMDSWLQTKYFIPTSYFLNNKLVDTHARAAVSGRPRDLDSPFTSRYHGRRSLDWMSLFTGGF